MKAVLHEAWQIHSLVATTLEAAVVYHDWLGFCRNTKVSVLTWSLPVMLARLEYRYHQARGSNGVMHMYVVLDQLYGRRAIDASG